MLVSRPLLNMSSVCRQSCGRESILLIDKTLSAKLTFFFAATMPMIGACDKVQAQLKRLKAVCRLHLTWPL